MKLLSLPYELQQLIRQQDSDNFNTLPWVDYRSLGILPEHIPALTAILEDIDDFPLCEDESPCNWLPLHAWRALSQLQAESALPTMIRLLHLIDDEDDEIVQVDLPTALAHMAPASVPLLTGFLNDLSNGPWSRLGAAEALQIAATEQPEIRPEIIAILSAALSENSSSDTTFLSVIVELLMRIKAVEAAPIVEKLYRSGKIDETICGDWEDYQISVGALESRLTKPAYHSLHPNSFLDGIIATSEALLDASEEGKSGGKAKKQRKHSIQATKAARKKK